MGGIYTDLREHVLRKVSDTLTFPQTAVDFSGPRRNKEGTAMIEYIAQNGEYPEWWFNYDTHPRKSKFGKSDQTDTCQSVIQRHSKACARQRIRSSANIATDPTATDRSIFVLVLATRGTELQRRWTHPPMYVVAPQYQCHMRAFRLTLY